MVLRVSVIAYHPFAISKFTCQVALERLERLGTAYVLGEALPRKTLPAAFQCYGEPFAANTFSTYLVSIILYT